MCLSLCLISLVSAEHPTFISNHLLELQFLLLLNFTSYKVSVYLFHPILSFIRFVSRLLTQHVQPEHIFYPFPFSMTHLL